MDIPVRRPSALRAGDTIGIVAPAGPVDSRDALQVGIATLERLGFHVRFEERIFQARGYLAGEDQERAGELMAFFEDPEVRAVLPLRGGYGCSRLIPHLAESRLRPHCKLFMGFSDLTTLHLYFRRRFGWVTLHGPMATTLAGLDSAAEDHLGAVLTDPDYRPELAPPGLEGWSKGSAEGVLTGGCLSLVTASLGTPYEIRTEGKILFLEDHGEAPYRIDRMLTQLRLSGKLEQCRGFLLGGFEDCDDSDGRSNVRDSLLECLTPLNLPILAGFPAGHRTSNWVLPFGTAVRLDADRCRLRFLEAAVASE